MIAPLGELQDTKNKRIESYMKGYQREQPDLIIQNLHTTYNGLCIEFKTPKGNGVLSDSQKKQLDNYKTILSNDYDSQINQINEYIGGLAPVQ